MPRPERLGGGVFLYSGDCLKSLERMKENSVDAVVTDPPYHLVSIVKRFGKENSAPAKHGSDGSFKRLSKGFMGHTWDGGDVAFHTQTWKKVYRVMKPGAHLVAFGSTRNYHRLVCAIEDAGFEIRDAISWLYGSGFPKSHDVSKGIDKKKNSKRKVVGEWKQPGRNKRTFINNAGLHLTSDSGEITEPATPESEYWDGWGTALKPAMELICLARKPLSEKTVAANVLKWGTGALNIDGCRIEASAADSAEMEGRSGKSTPNKIYGANINGGGVMEGTWEPRSDGRWPANVTHDGSIEVVRAFPVVGDSHPPCNEGSVKTNQIYGEDNEPRTYHPDFADNGSAARFFYNAKPDCRCPLCNALIAENDSSIQNIQTGSSVLDNVPGMREVLKPNKNASARGAKRNSKRCRLPNDASAPKNAQDSRLSKIVRNVKSAGNVCNLCATIIAQNVVAVKQGQNPESLPYLDSICERSARILHQSLVMYVAGREDTDTILTIESLKQFFGSVFHAIDKSTAENECGEKTAPERYVRRFHYDSKANSDDRIGFNHPTVKPVDLKQWLVRLVTPERGFVLDPFSGTGTTGEAAWREKRKAVLMEAEPKYQDMIRRRVEVMLKGKYERAVAKMTRKTIITGSLFGSEAADSTDGQDVLT